MALEKQPVRATRNSTRPDEFFNGIPGGDITEEQYEALDAEQRATVRTSGLWNVKTDAQMEPAIKRVEKAAEKATAATEKADSTAPQEG
jgi:hypothetical protein